MQISVNIPNPINFNATQSFGNLINEESIIYGVLTSGSGEVAPYVIRNEVGDIINVKYYNSGGENKEFIVEKDGEYSITLSQVTELPTTLYRTRGVSYSDVRFSKSNTILLTVGRRGEWECAAPINLSVSGTYAIPLIRTSTTGSANSLRRLVIMVEIKPENGTKYIYIRTGVILENYFNYPLNVRITTIDSIINIYLDKIELHKIPPLESYPISINVLNPGYSIEVQPVNDAYEFQWSNVITRLKPQYIGDEDVEDNEELLPTMPTIMKCERKCVIDTDPLPSQPWYCQIHSVKVY